MPDSMILGEVSLSALGIESFVGTRGTLMEKVRRWQEYRLLLLNDENACNHRRGE
jgi:hypothetical protein